MAWSKWKGACVLTLLASVGLAWSQTPMSNRPASSERIMTVHENGKELRCRVVQSWRTSTGAQAHQLQIIDTGEMMTIVEDGATRAVPGSQARAMPMRIFHWGRNERVSPAGAPVPPQTNPTAAKTTAPVIQTTSAQTVITSGPCAGVTTTPAPRVIGSSNERIVPCDTRTCQPINDCCTTGETRQGLLPRVFGATKSGPVVADNCGPTIVQKPIVAKPADPKPVDAFLANTKKDDKKQPFSTATAQTTTTPKASPLAIPSDSAKKSAASNTKPPSVPETAKKDDFVWRNMWGKQGDGKGDLPGQTTIDREKVRKDLPPASQTERRKQDILMAPEKFNPGSEKANPKAPTQLVSLPAPAQSMGPVPTPLGVQSVLAARNGAQGPVQYIPVPVATVPEPIRAPTAPEPRLPEPPNPTAFVNAFSPPPANNQQPLTPEQMQVVIQHQALMQQQAFLQQQAMMQRMQYGQTAQLIPVGYGMPMQVSYPAVYNGPQAPNPVAQQPIQQVGFMQPANAIANPAMDRRVQLVSAQQPALSDANTVAQIVQVLQESPYPAQREWAATNLSTFDCRVYPHLTQVLVQAARQDAAATVRAAAIYSMARMNVQSDPVLGTLQALRGDADPRVRQEVEQAYIRMGLTPTQP